MEDFRYNPPTTQSTPSGMPQQPVRPQMSAEHEHHSLPKTLLLIAALIVIAVAILWFVSGRELMQGDPSIDVAPQGEAVSNFPQELIPPGNPYIESSYSIAYKDAGTDFPVVTYTAKTAYEPTIDEFRRILQAEGWLILKDGAVEEHPVTNFYATKGEAEVNITIEDKEAGPWVTIAYSEPR